MWSGDFHNNDHEGCNKHDFKWKSPVYRELDKMLGFHLLIWHVFIFPLVLENFFVGKHPISIHQEDKRSPLKFFENEINQLVIKSWRKFYLICSRDSLTHILVEKVESSNWEKNRKTKSIKHGNPNNIENSWALEMDNIVSSEIQLFVSSHRSLFSRVNVFLEFLVKLS